jgi:hypothetical protein
MPQTAFSARQIYDTAPLGALIRFYDGTPEPPARQRCKRAAWSGTNGTGRLVRKTPASDLSVPGFKLHFVNRRGVKIPRRLTALRRRRGPPQVSEVSRTVAPSGRAQRSRSRDGQTAHHV